MHYQHRFIVKAPLVEVTGFHLHPAGLAQLTPPPTFLRIHHAHDPIRQGDRLTFTLWLGPIPVYWESLFPEVTETGFVDTQGQGPFRAWEHRHSFIPLDENTTEVVDVVEAHLRWHPWKTFIALIMWAALPVLFTYRARQTRRQLEKR